MNTCFRHICRTAVLLLAGFAVGVQAENAGQTSSEKTPAAAETTTETPIEATTDTTAETANGTARNKTGVGAEETTQDRIFRPSEDISEDLVIAFPVDI